MDIEEFVLLAPFSTLNLGGKARFFTRIRSVKEALEAVDFARSSKIPYMVLGKGSNCLFDDRGYNGLVILNKIDFCEIEGNLVRAGAGTSFPYLGLKTVKQGLSGLEFASGIPASVGGAVCMNAGALGQSTWDVIKEVTFLEDGKIKTQSKDCFSYGYRKTEFQGAKRVILSTTFCLEKLVNAKSKQKEMLSYRTNTQPYGEKSAGCIFKNGKDYSAGALIDQCGLKGETVGSAEVSKIHGNFIVANAGCTSKDIRKLIEVIKTKVKEEKGIELKTEVRVIPYES